MVEHQSVVIFLDYGEGGTAPVTKNLHVLCSISKSSTLFEKYHTSFSKLSKELKKNIKSFSAPSSS